MRNLLCLGLCTLSLSAFGCNDTPAAPIPDSSVTDVVTDTGSPTDVPRDASDAGPADVTATDAARDATTTDVTTTDVTTTDVTATDVTATDVTTTDVTTTDATTTDVTATDATTTDASASCGTTSCATGQICVRDQFNGGAVFMADDAGMCPDGRINRGGLCVVPPSFHCATRPAACTGTPTCACASTVCMSGYMCQGASDTQIDCVLNAP